MGYRVDLDELAAVIGSLDAFSQTLLAKIGDLDKAMSDLHVTWEGDAAIAHQRAQQDLSGGARDVHAALRDLHAVAQNAHVNYSNAVQANLDTWKQVR
jgi:WXG100 family type VII secretion target